MKKILAAMIVVGICLAMCSSAMAQYRRAYAPGYYPPPPPYAAPYRPVPPPRYYRPVPPPPPRPLLAPAYGPYYPRTGVIVNRGSVNVNVPGVGVHVGW